MITKRFAAIYGWVTLAILVILLILVLTKSVDRSLQLPILIFAGTLIASRVILRNLIRRREQDPSGDGETD